MTYLGPTESAVPRRSAVVTVLGTYPRMRAQAFLQVKALFSGSTYRFCLEHSLIGTATDRDHGKVKTDRGDLKWRGHGQEDQDREPKRLSSFLCYNEN